MNEFAEQLIDRDILDAIDMLSRRCAQQGLRLVTIGIEGTRPDVTVNMVGGPVWVHYTPKKAGEFFLRAVEIERRRQQLEADIAAFKAEFAPDE